MRSPRWLLALLVLVLVALPATGGGPAAATPPGLLVEILDVGQGDAILITSPTGKRVLVDSGPPEAGARLAAALEKRGIEALDLAVLTHPHTDHAGGFRAAFRQAPPKLFLDPGLAHTAPAYRQLLRDLAKRKVPVRDARAGRTIDLGGGAKAEILWPPERPPKRLDINDRSVVMRVSLGEVAFLLTGDIGARTEALLLRDGAERLASRVLKVAHHGSRHSSSGRFLAAVGAAEAPISVGAGNPFGHPTPEALSRVGASGATIRRTDRDGTIAYVTDGRALSVRSFPEAGAPVVAKGQRRRR